MNRLITIIVAALAIAGCGTSHLLDSTTNVSESNVERIEELYWTTVSLPSDIKTSLTLDSQHVDNNYINSHVVAFKFTNNGNPIEIEISSIVKKLGVFAPNLALYDQDFNVIREFDSESFDYDRNDFMAGEVLHGLVTINVPLSITEVHALVFTTQNDLKQTTTLIHPAKAIAIAKRNSPPEIPDPVAKHRKFGDVKISARELGSKSFFSKKQKSAAAPEIPMQNTSLNNVKITAALDTVTYYKTAIQKAVQGNDIPKALALLEEAKALNIKGAQDVFVEAVNAYKQ